MGTYGWELKQIKRVSLFFFWDDEDAVMKHTTQASAYLYISLGPECRLLDRILEDKSISIQRRLLRHSLCYFLFLNTRCRQWAPEKTMWTMKSTKVIPKRAIWRPRSAAYYCQTWFERISQQSRGPVPITSTRTSIRKPWIKCNNRFEAILKT